QQRRLGRLESRRPTQLSLRNRDWRALLEPMLTFLGDVFLKNPVSIEVDLPGGVVFNLEAPLTDAEHGYPRKINLKADPDNLDATFTTTPLAVNLANNHILDFFENGLESTLAALDARGVQHF